MRTTAKRCVQPFPHSFSGSNRYPTAVLARFCWDLLAYKRYFTPEPVLWLHHTGRLRGAISSDNIRLAVTLLDEADAMFWWRKERWKVADWTRDSEPFSALLSHESYLVRAAAAKVLGTMFRKLHPNMAPVVEVLAFIQRREIETPGIAGPFLHGLNWDREEWVAVQFDIKAWVLETLRQSRQEPNVPHLISLEMFAHELFACDAADIRAFLGMGRRHLAVLTATENPDAIQELLPLLNEMAVSDDPGVAAAITEYLAVRSTHAGLGRL